MPGEGEPDLKFTLNSSRHPLSTFVWFHHWGEDVQFAKIDNAYLMRIAEIADFELHPERVECYPHADMPEYTLRHLFLHQALPALLSFWPEYLILHASAVELDGKAVCFLGESGAGKSTIAAHLLRQGARLVTDDVLILKEVEDKLLAVSSYPGLRVWPGTVDGATIESTHYSDKRRYVVKAEEFLSGALPLQQLFILDGASDGSYSFRELNWREHVLELGRFAFRVDCKDPSQQEKEFEQLTKLISKTPTALMFVPDDLSKLACLPESINRYLDV